MVELKTERLILRPIQPDDVDEVFAIVGDPDAMRYMPKVYTREEAQEFWVDRVRVKYDTDGHSFFAVTLASDGTFLGICGPLEQDVEFPDGMRHYTEVGYHFQPKHWGHGYAAEAAIACRNWVFETLGRDEVISLIDPENVPSQRVAMRNGMSVKERGVKLRDHVIDLYHISREEWETLDDKNKPRVLR